MQNYSKKRGDLKHNFEGINVLFHCGMWCLCAFIHMSILAARHLVIKKRLSEKAASFLVLK